MSSRAKKLQKEMGEIIGFHPTNLNPLYLLHLFYSDIEIITLHGRLAIGTLIAFVWAKVLKLAVPCMDSEVQEG